ncbi:MAG: Mur ligase family protein, partial [Brevinematales bacterium]
MVDIGFIEKSLKIPPIKIGHPKNSIVEGFSIDSREITPNQCFVAINGENYNGHNFIRESNIKGVRFFIVQNDYKNKVKKYLHNSYIIPVKDTVESLSMLAKSYKKHIFASSIGITGSSGKTTTRELISLLLSSKYNVHTSKKNYNNDIGLPLTILQAPPETHILVLEMGMNHRGELKKLSETAEPLLGLITNVGYAHIGMFGSLEKIAEAKAEIFSGIHRHGIALLNRDDGFLEYFKKISPVDTIEFGLSD